MDIQRVDLLVQAIRSLSEEERVALEEKLFFDDDEPTSDECAALALKGGSFNFLADEPDLYSLDDSESVQTFQRVLERRQTAYQALYKQS